MLNFFEQLTLGIPPRHVLEEHGIDEPKFKFITHTIKSIRQLYTKDNKNYTNQFELNNTQLARPRSNPNSYVDKNFQSR